MRLGIWATVLLCAVQGPLGGLAGPVDALDSHASPQSVYNSPSALVASADGKWLYIACATANQVAFFDTTTARVSHRIAVPQPPSGLALSHDGFRLYVTCAGPASTVAVLDVARRQIVRQIPVGHTAIAPVLSPDGKRLYVCNRFENDVSVLDLTAGRELERIRVEREPVAAAITPDGRYLVVANHLHAGTANRFEAAAAVTVIDTGTGRVAKHIPLIEGAGLLRGVAVSPDGRLAAVPFVWARYWLSATGVEEGRMNSSAVAVIDLTRLSVMGILLLDQTARGAANPWAVAWTPDGRTIIVSHAGTHGLSLIEVPADVSSQSFGSLRLGAYFETDNRVPSPVRRPIRVRQRLALPGEGPRAIAVVGSRVYVANYFSDNLSCFDLAAGQPTVRALSLGPARVPDVVRRGEMLFNDARLCRQGWQSCASCHDCDGRTDAFNWDLPNDGLGNPKNTKSLVCAYETPPAMALGVRTNAAAAVRAGIHHILFTDQPETVPAAIDAFLKSLRPQPSPHLVDGHLSVAAERGKRLFMSSRTGCAVCHPPPWFTDLAAHDVGSAAERYRGLWGRTGVDQPSDHFDTPTLLELWRTAPYLHHGAAATARAVLTTMNPHDRHGSTSQLTAQEIDDLTEYLLSL